MGCGGSKLEEEGAILLCRKRTQFLADAIRHRYALADAHAAYARSLTSVGAALQGLLLGARALPPESPVLNLPAQRKGDPLPPLTPSPPPPAVASVAAAAAVAPSVTLPSAALRGHSHSHSGSHIRFHPSDSDTEDDSPLHSDGASPIHHLSANDAPVAKTYVNLNYARKGPTEATVTYEQQPQGSESIRFGSVEESSPMAYPYYGYPYPPQSSNFYPYPSYPYMNYDGVTGNGFYASSSPPQNIPPSAMAAVGSSTARDPPPPPSPKASTWDFLNPFQSYDNYYAAHTPSRSSGELREEEGIPDLEDEEQEVVKEAYGDPKFVASTSAAANGEYSGKAAVGLKDGTVSSVGEDNHRKSKSVEARNSSNHEVHVVEKSVVIEPAERRNVGFTVSRSYNNDSDIAMEIKTQFDRASQSADQVSKMLEVGKHPYHYKNSVCKVSVRMICALPPPSTSKNEELLVFEEDKAMGCGNLSSTLQKLYNWENKLLEEVMAEEKMRILYERKREHLRHLIDRGAEAEKLEAVETSIRKLSAKLRIAIQVVATISSKISQLRDEELWPQISELILGFMEMWRVMSECHHIQCQAISEAKNLDSIVSAVKLNDANMTVVKQLELVMVDWISNFSAWVSAQRSYVKSLNGWLMKCIHYEPEVTDDGIIPFSPGRLGAPPIFVICNSWASSVDMVSEREVVEATESFVDNVFNIWQQYKIEQQPRLLANRDMDNKLRLMEREEQEMLKQKKKLMLIVSENGRSIPEHHGSTVNSLHSTLRHIFEAVENFSANAMKAYEVLHTQTEQEKQRLIQDNA